MTAKTEDARSATLSGFEDILQKCEASLMPAIEEHVENEAFDSAKDGLDFLEVSTMHDFPRTHSCTRSTDINPPLLLLGQE
jgi:hypothetical protein